MLDSKLNVFLLLFDLSAAFDTVSHRILLSKLHDVYGLDGKVLAWLTSYVINRKYFVEIDQSASCDVQALFGVSQGSILGPILFNLYFRDTEKLAKSHGLQIHRYADDMQCYFGAERQLSRNLIADKIRCFVHDVKSWMSNNFLKLNENKTNVIEFASTGIDKCKLLISVNFDVECHVKHENCVKSLGVLLDDGLNFDKHINKVVSVC